MSAERTSHGPKATPSKDQPSDRGRDGRKTAHDDSTDATPNNPPDHGKSTNPGEPNTFLEWCHPETPVDATVLQEKWDYWYPRSVDETRKPAEDRAPTWDTLDGGWSR
jgi:hypothetical protein